MSPVASEGIVTHLPLVIAFPLGTGEEVSGLERIVKRPRLSRQKYMSEAAFPFRLFATRNVIPKVEEGETLGGAVAEITPKATV
jgi:hypothetical protein